MAHSCSVHQIVQHRGIFAEWAFGAHAFNQEVKGVAMETKKNKQMCLTHSSIPSSLSFVLLFSQIPAYHFTTVASHISHHHGGPPGRVQLNMKLPEKILFGLLWCAFS